MSQIREIELKNVKLDVYCEHQPEENDPPVDESFEIDGVVFRGDNTHLEDLIVAVFYSGFRQGMKKIKKPTFTENPYLIIEELLKKKNDE